MTDAELRNSVYLLMAKLCAARKLYEENQRGGVRAAVASLSVFVTQISYHGGIPHLPLARLDDMLGHLGLALRAVDVHREAMMAAARLMVARKLPSVLS